MSQSPRQAIKLSEAMDASPPKPAQDFATLFMAAFRQSRNPMVLVDGQRRQVDVNGAYLRLLGYRRDQLVGRPVYEFIVDGPRASPSEWADTIAAGRFTGETDLRAADGSQVAVQYAATSEIITGRNLVLFVATAMSRWGARYRRTSGQGRRGVLSAREQEILRLVALGGSGPEIADELQISHDTVRTHMRNAMGKVDARSRAHLVAKALGEGLIFETPR